MEACIRQRGFIESGKVNTNRMFQYFKHSPKQSLTGKLFKCKELYESGQTDRRTDRQIYRTTVQWTDLVKLELKVQRPQYYLQLQTDSRERESGPLGPPVRHQNSHMRLFPSFECYGFAVFMHFCQTLDLVQVISSGFSSSDVQQNNESNQKFGLMKEWRVVS